MPNPKYRISAARRDRRRSHLALTVNHGCSCPNCGVKRYPHRVCESCGHYKGKQVMEPRVADTSFADTFDPNEA